MGLGFPNAMQVKVTLLPSFASTYCGGVSVNVGGAVGQGETTMTPLFHPWPLWVWGAWGQWGGCHLQTGDTPHIPVAGDHPKGKGGRQWLSQGLSPGTPADSTPSTPRCTPALSPLLSLPAPGHGTTSPPHSPPLHINSLLSKHGKTPQCRSKGSFLIKEAGRITARP